MPVTELNHQETWNIRITREEGDDWPDVQMPDYYAREGKDAPFMVPDRLVIEVHRTGRHPSYTIQGRNRKKDGQPGKGHWATFTLPGWAVELCRTARTALGVTEELTGVPL